MTEGTANEWYIRLVPRPSSNDTTNKFFSLMDLLYVPQEDDNNSDGRGTTEKRIKNSPRLTEGGVVLGRKSHGDSHNGEFPSPIVSRCHAQLNITLNGHVFLTDLGSLHGTQIIPSASISSFMPQSEPFKADRPPVYLKSYAPVQICHGDTLLLGKAVQSGREDYHPVEVRVLFRYPELGKGSSNGKRTKIGPITPEFADGKFASVVDIVTLSAVIRRTGTWRAERPIMTDSLKHVVQQGLVDQREEEIQETTHSCCDEVLDTSVQLKGKSHLLADVSSERSDVESGHGDRMCPFSLKDDVLSAFAGPDSKPSGYRVPASVLYQSEDEPELPRGSAASHQNEEADEAATDDERPEVRSAHRRLSNDTAQRPGTETGKRFQLLQTSRLISIINTDRGTYRADSINCPLISKGFELFDSVEDDRAPPRLPIMAPSTLAADFADFEKCCVDCYRPGGLPATMSPTLLAKLEELRTKYWSYAREVVNAIVHSGKDMEKIREDEKMYGANGDEEEKEPSENVQPETDSEAESAAGRDPAYGRWYSYSSDLEEELESSYGQDEQVDTTQEDLNEKLLHEEKVIKSEEHGHERGAIHLIRPARTSLSSQGGAEYQNVKKEDTGKLEEQIEERVERPDDPYQQIDSGSVIARRGEPKDLHHSVAGSEGRLQTNHFSKLLQAQKASIKDASLLHARQMHVDDCCQPDINTHSEALAVPTAKSQVDWDDEEGESNEQEDEYDHEDEYDQEDEVDAEEEYDGYAHGDQYIQGDQYVQEDKHAQEDDYVEEEEDVMPDEEEDGLNEEHDEEESHLGYPEDDGEVDAEDERDSIDHIIEGEQQDVEGKEEQDENDQPGDVDEAVKESSEQSAVDAMRDVLAGGLLRRLASPVPVEKEASVMVTRGIKVSTPSSANEGQKGDGHRTTLGKFHRLDDAVTAEDIAARESHNISGQREAALPTPESQFTQAICTQLETDGSDDRAPWWPAEDHESLSRQPEADTSSRFGCKSPVLGSEDQVQVRTRTSSFSGVSSAGPITPSTSLKRGLPNDFDVPTSPTGPASISRAPKKMRQIASTFGLVALGAALGSVSTIAALMQLAD